MTDINTQIVRWYRTAIQLMDDVLSQKKDNIALIERVLKKEDALFR